MLISFRQKHRKQCHKFCFVKTQEAYFLLVVDSCRSLVSVSYFVWLKQQLVQRLFPSIDSLSYHDKNESRKFIVCLKDGIWKIYVNHEHIIVVLLTYAFGDTIRLIQPLVRQRMMVLKMNTS